MTLERFGTKFITCHNYLDAGTQEALQKWGTGIEGHLGRVSWSKS